MFNDIAHDNNIKSLDICFWNEVNILGDERKFMFVWVVGKVSFGVFDLLRIEVNTTNDTTHIKKRRNIAALAAANL